MDGRILFFAFFGILLGGLIYFNVDLKNEMNQEEKIMSADEIEAKISKEYAEIELAFDGNNDDIYKAVPYIYSYKSEIFYNNESGEWSQKSEDIRKEYLKRIESTDWNGILPTTVEIHIKERWNNTPSQIKQLYELSQLMKKNEVRASTIIYNSTNNLSDTSSVWFSITDNSYPVNGLANLEDIKSIKDIEKTDTIYHGFFQDDKEFETLKFDGSPI